MESITTNPAAPKRDSFLEAVSHIGEQTTMKKLSRFVQVQKIHQVPTVEPLRPQIFSRYAINEVLMVKVQCVVNMYAKKWQELADKEIECMEALADLLDNGECAELITDELREAKFSSLKAIFNKGKIRLNTRLNTDIDEQFKRWKNWDGTMSDYAQKILRYWIMTHIDNPYPTDDEKLLLAFKGSIAIRQVNSWFGNQRGRVKKRILNQMEVYGHHDGTSDDVEPWVFKEEQSDDSDDRPKNHSAQVTRAAFTTRQRELREKLQAQQDELNDLSSRRRGDTPKGATSQVRLRPQPRMRLPPRANNSPRTALRIPYIDVAAYPDRSGLPLNFVAFSAPSLVTRTSQLPNKRKCVPIKSAPNCGGTIPWAFQRYSLQAITLAEIESNSDDTDLPPDTTEPRLEPTLGYRSTAVPATLPGRGYHASLIFKAYAQAKPGPTSSPVPIQPPPPTEEPSYKIVLPDGTETYPVPNKGRGKRPYFVAKKRARPKDDESSANGDEYIPSTNTPTPPPPPTESIPTLKQYLASTNFSLSNSVASHSTSESVADTLNSLLTSPAPAFTAPAPAPAPAPALPLVDVEMSEANQ